VYYRVSNSQLQNGRMTLPSENGQSQTTPQRASGQDGQGKGQTATRKFVFTAWGDSVDRDLCAYALAELPERTPIAGRTGLATAEWVVVDRVDGRALICNRLHDGECAWPWAVESV
jgi:hypothetical protein